MTLWMWLPMLLLLVCLVSYDIYVRTSQQPNTTGTKSMAPMIHLDHLQFSSKEGPVYLRQPYSGSVSVPWSLRSQGKDGWVLYQGEVRRNMPVHTMFFYVDREARGEYLVFMQKPSGRIEEVDGWEGTKETSPA
jgi:hypothetical protein